jgi:hypothetical protein
MLAATINFDFEFEPVAFVKAGHAGALDSRDVDESIGLPVIALNEAEALHRVEELYRAAAFFAGQRALRRAAKATAAFARGIAITRRRTIRDGKRLTFDLEIRRRDLAAAIHQREAEWLSFGQTRQAGLLNGRNVHEHIFAAIIADNKAEAFLPVEKLDHASAFANDLRGHATTGTTTAAGKTAAAAAAAETTAAATAAESVAATAKAITAAAKPVTAASKAAAITTAAAAAFIAETVALVASASAAITAATFIKTHAVPVLSSKSPACSFKKHPAPDAGKMLPGTTS